MTCKGHINKMTFEKINTYNGIDLVKCKNQEDRFKFYKESNIPLES